ncbi:universal stress protein [Bdellovibrio bacteriovorus]|uniref:Universal stress protein n=1 Tax=Bdellovibrio bacteriovorus TaxID=959 RepID=A0A162G6U4_BDEBC|nr:universal stress protein [Bdellovibrio bacteriovorus]KYG65134.1 universal stress protein [Bdellovibrio bacteriovorus]
MRIIWAIDAFEDNKELNQKMADYITHLHETTQAEIEPLYLLRENEIVLPTYEVPAWVTDHSKTAESLFREVLSDYNLPFLKEPKVIPHASQSHAGAAETLSNYALKSHADLIIVGSHGRQGFQRFILGSFAESLLLQSEVPVCVVGSHALKTRSSRSILFPTEFGEHSKDNFRHVLDLARKFNAEVLLLHAIARPIESLFDLDTRPRVYNYDGKMMTLEQIVESQIEAQSHRAQQWVDWAAKEGVIAHFHIDNTFKPIDELILDAIETHQSDLIVMEAQSGPMSAALLGSYTRNVVRKATCPVYVLTRHFYDKQEDRFIDTPAP